jgi:hypothetical protein
MLKSIGAYAKLVKHSMHASSFFQRLGFPKAFFIHAATPAQSGIRPQKRGIQ